MKKILVFTIISFCLVFTINAQEEDSNSSFFDEVTFGVKAGSTISTSGSGSQGTNNSQKDGGRTQISYHFGAVAELKLSEKFSFQTELLYSNEKSQTQKEDEQYEASYIQIPLLIKYYFSNQFSIEAGPQVGFLMSSDLITKEQDRVDELKTIDIRVVVGLAYKFNNGIFFGGRYDLYLTDPKKMIESDDISFPVSYSKFRNGLISAYVGYSF